MGEVKEGPPRPNRAMRDPVVLEAALTRYAAKAGNGAAGANYDRRDRKDTRLRGAQRVSASRSSSSEFSARRGSWSGSIGTTSSSPVSRCSFANG